MLKKNYNQFGFTLIELLVSITIMLLLLASALAFFLEYLDKRSVSDSVDEIKTYFQRAISEAAAGNLGGCEQLNGYRIVSNKVANVTSISLQPDCLVGTPDPVVSFDLTPGVEVSPNLNYVFRVLQAGVDLPGGVASQVITISKDEHIYNFTIYREGRFNTGDWQ